MADKTINQLTNQTDALAVTDELPIWDASAAATKKSTFQLIVDLINAAIIAALRLDQLQVPTANVSMNNRRLTSLASPSDAADAATKGYVDGLDNGKTSVKAAATGNITLSGTQTIDGISCVAGDRVLVPNQTIASQNGLYTVASGAWTRPADADTWDELVSAYVFVEQGTSYGDTGWLCTIDPGGTLGTTDITWTAFAEVTEPWQIACSSATTALTTGDNQGFFVVPYDAQTVEIPFAAVRVVSSSGTITVDINKNGTTILSTKITIDANENTSLTAAAAAVLTTTPTSFTKGDRITVDVDGAGTDAVQLVVNINVRKI